MSIKLRTLDPPRTTEQQLELLRDKAHMAWCCWNNSKKRDCSDKYREKLEAAFDQAMREVFQQCVETDIFLSGMMQGCKSC